MAMKVCVFGGRLRPFIINVHRGVLTSSEPRSSLLTCHPEEGPASPSSSSWHISPCVVVVHGLVSRPVTLGKSWNLISASQTLSRTDLPALAASRRAPPPHTVRMPPHARGWPLAPSSGAR
uniref:Uncharacterized protein n=1 Tax=Knipowitschia caucasica TaxID=637954 RepID=A0AAV2J795_KNICA